MAELVAARAPIRPTLRRSRPRPLVTRTTCDPPRARAHAAQTTASIEEIIKARIKDAMWDDVLRRSALQPSRYRPKAAELSTEKSKLGLGEEYAKDYEQQMLGASSAESSERAAAHEAVRLLFAKLGGRLDALFNFHSAPPPHKREATVRSAVAAVRMEEATPTAMADSEGLAPEEVYGARRGNALTTRTELSQAERKAQRRKKKRVRKRQSAERDESEALRAKLEPDGAAAKRREARAAEQALADAKRKGSVLEGPLAGGGKGGGKSGRAGSQFTRSAQFFRGMQEQEKGTGGAGGKRARPGGGAEEPPSKATRFKL
jgi:U3 small nucleolar RNA-associated protein MPP10